MNTVDAILVNEISEFMLEAWQPLESRHDLNQWTDLQIDTLMSLVMTKRIIERFPDAADVEIALGIYHGTIALEQQYPKKLPA